jgi:hypothetical protein
MTGCEFVTGEDATEESYVEWPDHHAMAQADAKHWRAFAAIGSDGWTRTLRRVSYRTDADDPGRSWTTRP